MNVIRSIFFFCSVRGEGCSGRAKHRKVWVAHMHEVSIRINEGPAFTVRVWNGGQVGCRVGNMVTSSGQPNDCEERIDQASLQIPLPKHLLCSIFAKPGLRGKNIAPHLFGTHSFTYNQAELPRGKGADNKFVHDEDLSRPRVRS